MLTVDPWNRYHLDLTFLPNLQVNTERFGDFHRMWISGDFEASGMNTGDQ